MLSGKTLLITGGTGSFGHKFVEIALKECNPKTIRIYSRSELPQIQMASQFPDSRLRFFVGDVRDNDRLFRACNGVDIIVHAAALKHVPICEYNPIEAIRTNIEGSINVVNCAIENKVQKVIGISSDKAVAPTNLYGSTKMVMEKLFTQSNVYGRSTKFACTRYGNVVGSRGSVIPIFKEQAKTGKVTITDKRMTRFWLTLEQGVWFVLNCLTMIRGGEVFVPKIPSAYISEIAKIISPKARHKIIGIRPGEKLHEKLISEDEIRHTREFEDYFVIYPEFPYWTEEQYWDLTGNKPCDDFEYKSNTNDRWLTKEQIVRLVDAN